MEIDRNPGQRVFCEEKKAFTIQTLRRRENARCMDGTISCLKGASHRSEDLSTKTRVEKREVSS